LIDVDSNIAHADSVYARKDFFRYHDIFAEESNKHLEGITTRSTSAALGEAVFFVQPFFHTCRFRTQLEQLEIAAT